MAGKLKPCPFCGNEAPHITSEADHPEWGSGGRFYYVKCGKCRAQSGSKYASAGNDCPIFYEEVRSEWNKRAESDGHQKMLSEVAIEAMAVNPFIRGEANKKAGE